MAYRLDGRRPGVAPNGRRAERTMGCMTILNIRGAIAWWLLELAEALSRAAHELCGEVPDIDGIRADAFDWGRRVSTR